ncbi:MAG: hypothetical protein ACREDL_12590 [Bradyrhizobium sp.]
MQMKFSTALLALLAGFLTSLGTAYAQAPPTPATPMERTAAPAPQHSASCTPVKPGPPHGTIAPNTTVGQANPTLGDQLARSNGVLCPPSNIDPGMRAPTPNVGNTPVIPPPGSPDVQPK